MTNKIRFYILIGEEQNWKISIQKRIWGFKENSKGSWRTTQINDLVVFYVTKPIQKIIGFGIVKNKYSDDKITWDDENFHKRSLWKFKISFDIFHVCKDWQKGISLPKGIFLQVSRKVIEEDLFFDLVKKADSKWHTKILKKLEIFSKN